MAADTLTSSGAGTPNYHFEFTTKIVRHPELPLAFAFSGLANLPAQGAGSRGVLVADAVASALSQIYSASQLFPGIVLRFLVDTLNDEVANAKRVLEAKGEPHDEDLVRVVFGLVGRNGTFLGDVVFGDRAVSGGKNLQEHLLGTQSPSHVYKTKDRGAGLFAVIPPDPENIARRARSLVREGIREEARIHGGTNQEVGGDVDAVIVDATGCRSWP